MSEVDVLKEIDLFLALCKTASLATSDQEGKPFAANVQIAHAGDLRLMFLSESHTQHAKNLALHADAAMTIYGHDDRPDQIHGLQLRGRCERIENDTRAGLLEIYFAKYPFAAEAVFSAIIQKQGVFLFSPTWFRWIDNRRGFGWKFEKSLI